jgi:hypothetical protein
MDFHQYTIDLDWLVGNLPVELKTEIKNVTFLMQMQKSYSTNNLKTIASRIFGEEHYGFLETKARWINTLVSTSIKTHFQVDPIETLVLA